MPTPRVLTTLLLAGLLLVPAFSHSEVGVRPDTPNTGAYVSEIDTDWVKVSVGTGTLAIQHLEDLQGKIDSDPELWNLAEFACKLYNRTSVLLSRSYDANQHFVSRIDYLFACGIE